MTLREVRLYVERPVQECDRLLQAVALLGPQVVARLQIELVHLLTLRQTLDDGTGVRSQELPAQTVDDRLRDVLLDLEDVPELPVVVLGPELGAVRRADQVRRDAKALARLPHAAFQDGRDAQSLADFRAAEVSQPAVEGRRSADDPQSVDAGQRVDEFFRHPVAEEVLFRIRAQVGEGPDRDGPLQRSFHRRDEAVAATRKSDDVLHPVVLPQALAQHGEVVRQIALVDGGVGPHHLHQILLVEEAAVVLDQRPQRVEDLRPEGDGFPLPEQSALPDVEQVRAEQVGATIGNQGHGRKG